MIKKSERRVSEREEGELRWWFLKCNHRRTDKCGTFLLCFFLYFLLFLSHFYFFSRYTRHAKQYTISFIVWIQTEINTRSWKNRYACIFACITWKFLEKKYKKKPRKKHAVKSSIFVCYVYISPYLLYVNLIFSFRLCWLSSVIIYCSCCISVGIFTFWYVICKTYNKPMHTHSSEHLVELGIRNTWWKIPA